MEFNNSYAEYKGILENVKATGKLCSFSEAADREEFCILRHDVEFNLDKAYRMAEIEYESGVSSVYFVQIGSDAYNAFSDTNIELIKNIQSLGHEIGLHYRQSRENSADYDITKQLVVMSMLLGFNVKVFSTHRPKADTAYEKYCDGKNVINAYGEHYFSRTDNLSEVQVKYISDSKYQWNYGYPSREELLSHPKVQLLVHPFQWWKEPLRMTDCFDNLLYENRCKQKHTYINEFRKLKEIAYGSEKMDL